jgi:HPt (histidine-containing phosphotransfer) domain-containing protein
VLRQWIRDTAPDDGTPAPPPSAAAEERASEQPAVSLAEHPPTVVQRDVVDVSRIEMLHEMVKDGVSLFQRSSGNFIAHAQDHLTAICDALDTADADQLMATAHKLKGSALNLGLPRVGAAALVLEENGREGRLDGSTEAYVVLEREMVRAVTALERERAARTSG